MPRYIARTDSGTLTFTWSPSTPAAPLQGTLQPTPYRSLALTTCPSEQGECPSPRAAATRLAEFFRLGAVAQVAIDEPPPVRVPRSR